jgi:hypothetical protein
MVDSIINENESKGPIETVLRNEPHELIVPTLESESDKEIVPTIMNDGYKRRAQALLLSLLVFFLFEIHIQNIIF